MLHIIPDSHFKVEVINTPIDEYCIPGLSKYLDLTDYAPLELATITFNCSGFPHSVPMQLRTHRHQITFDVQSQRYSGLRAIQVANYELPLDEVFYIRKEMSNDNTWQLIMSACRLFKHLVEIDNIPYEAARDILPQGIRQNFVFSCSLRTLLHLLDLRYKPDAQAEIQTLSHMLIQATQPYFPLVIGQYQKTRATKGMLAP